MTIKDCEDCPEMVVVPAGSFVMGSDGPAPDGTPADIAASQRPAHTVTIAKPFAVSRTEITRAQYEAFVRATNRSDAERCFVWNEIAGKWENTPGVTWRAPGFAQRPDEPAVCVSWTDAVDYASWLTQTTGQTYRLLSESEWEYAAQSSPQPCAANVSDQTRKTIHRKAETLDARAFFGCSDGYAFTAPVGRFPANGFGLHDMTGNVWEWIADCHNESYRGAPPDGSAWLTGDCTERGNRGGSWADPIWRTRPTLREWDPAGGRYVINGIRVARDLAAPQP
jgi:formylglycine-generating enzyme required for sulfatase activity